MSYYGIPPANIHVNCSIINSNFNAYNSSDYAIFQNFFSNNKINSYHFMIYKIDINIPFNEKEQLVEYLNKIKLIIKFAGININEMFQYIDEYFSIKTNPFNNDGFGQWNELDNGVKWNGNFETCAGQINWHNTTDAGNFTY